MSAMFTDLNFSTPINRFRVVALGEGLSFLVLLFVAMPLKYIWGEPLLVRWVGALHGGLFIAYVVYLLEVHFKEKWPIWKSLIAFLLSFVPFGTFWIEYKWLNPKPLP
jgi:integral membrane protein